LLIVAFASSRQNGVIPSGYAQEANKVTQIGHGFGAAAFTGNATPFAGKIMGDFVAQLTAGIIGEFTKAFGAGPNAFGQLPSQLDVRAGIVKGGCVMPRPKCPGPIICPKPAAQWTATIDGTNTAKINLGDGYRLEIDERNSQMTIINDKTGEKTRIWGDPHVEIDGKHAYDFWGTTTFTLENGTKITINTEQWNGNPNAYVASQVVITKGDNAIIVDGISQNKLGDLSVSMSNNGYAVDAATRDGYTLHENETGGGWRTEAGSIATQNDLNATAIGREYGPGSELPSLSELGEQLGSFLLLGAFASFLGSFLNQRLDLGNNTGERVKDFNDRMVRDTILTNMPVRMA
jgi:Domain of Unknown Function (DUF1521)